MSQSLILTRHPAIHLRLQKQFEKASRSFLSFEKFVEKSVLEKNSQFQPWSTLHKIKFIQKWLDSKREALDILEMIQSLRQSDISSVEWESAIRKYPFSIKKQEFLLEIHKIYKLYEAHPFYVDRVWMLQKAIQNLKKSQKSNIDIQHLLVLSLALTPLERDFLNLLSECKVKIETLRAERDTPKHGSISLVRVDSPEEQVEWIAKEIRLTIETGIHPSEIFIFGFDLHFYKPLILRIFSDIPFQFWNTKGELESVSIFPWNPNTLVFGGMKRTFILGLSRWRKRSEFLTEEDKNYFNQTFGKSVFVIAEEEKMRLREELYWVASHTDHLCLITAKDLPSSFKEFLEEMGALGLEAKGSETIRSQTTCRDTVQQRLGASDKNPWHTGGGIIERISQSLIPGTDFQLPNAYSVRSLSQYQRCPFGFLVKVCLGLHPLKSPQDELDALEEGELLHALLKDYFSLLKEKTSIDMKQFLADSFKRRENDFKKNIWEPQKYRIQRIFVRFVEEEKKWQDSFIPFAFEWPFNAFTLSLNGESIGLRGKVDRIDIDETSKTFRVIDYKTGASLPSQKEVMEGKEFQLPLYAMAVEELLLKGFFPKEAFYYQIPTVQKKKAFSFSSQDEWLHFKKVILSQIATLYRGIKELHFHGTPDSCYEYCEMKKLCVRQLSKPSPTEYTVYTHECV